MIENEAADGMESKSFITGRQSVAGEEEEGQIEDGNDREGSVNSTGVDDKSAKGSKNHRQAPDSNITRVISVIRYFLIKFQRDSLNIDKD